MPTRPLESSIGDRDFTVRELREKVQEMEAERRRQQRQNRRQQILLGLALSLAAHLGLMAVLAAIHRAGHGGGSAPQPISYEFAIIQDEQLTELQSREFDELVPETLEFQDLVPVEASAEFAVDASAPELELSGGSAVPSLGGAGGGTAGTPGLGGGGAGTSFFGITSEGTRFAFIVDISGSMGQGSKLSTAMEELANSIRALPDFAHFYIVLFSSGHVVPPMQRGWTRARPSTVRSYVRWLQEVSPGGGTEPRSAFEQVFALDVRPDVIYFLTDGQITGMSAEDIAALNRRGKGVIINTVAFGELGRQELLRRIARESDGTHKDVPSFQMLHVSATISALLLAVGAAAHAESIHRRGAEPTLRGRITAVDDGGVTLRSDGGTEHVVPWDRVRAIDIDRTVPALDRRLRTATDLWRARSRVERHDTTLAEPLLERLWATHHGQNHETALVVAEGLLRCRLDRGAHAAALVPALEVARLRRRDVTTLSYSMLPPVLDEATLLCPSLAPAWLPSRALDRLRVDLERYDPQGDAVVARIAALYHASIAGPGAPLREPISAEPPESPGIDLLETLLALDADSADEREAARERLEATIDDAPAWVDAWTRYAVGASLLAEPGRGRRHRGLLSLAYVPAVHGANRAWLSGLALARMIAGLEELGDAERAATLRDELERAHPTHPVRALLEAGAWPPPAPAARSEPPDKDHS